MVTDIDSAGLKTYSYDDAFRITGITDAANSSLSQSYGYDLLDRLTSATGTSLNQGWSYDANGNRLTQTGSAASIFTVSSTNNRLSSVSGALTRSYSYDNSGNTTGDGSATFTYNDAGRMISATKASVTTTYALNALGQRVKKTASGSSRYFAYDEAGHLVGEYDNSGTLIQETVWFGDTPVATLRPNGAGVSLFYVHTDHLNTPRRISRPSDNVVVWRWDSDPFGATAANEDPDADSNLFAYNLRLPGQYLDPETGLHYNYMRDGYDSATGRYTQSDPIGIAGGTNTYAYVGGNPNWFFDREGLEMINWLPKNDPNYPAAEKIPDDPTVCLVISHGSNRSVRFMNAKQLNDALSKRCKPKQKIKLDACNAGKGENSIAEQLAKLRKGIVSAPDDRVWTTWWDTEMQTPYPPVSEDKDSGWNRVPDISRPGSWREFGPDGPTTP
jgi:RHS repeat-associated protein